MARSLTPASSQASASSSMTSSSNGTSSGSGSSTSTSTSITTLPLDHLLSSTAHDDFPARRHLSDISTAIAKARRVVVVSGAGISCSSGIPDFRSADGLYSLVKSRYPDTFFTGKDLFSSGLFSNPETTSIFYTFIAELSLSCLQAQPTRTHHFIRRLEQKGKLLRSYTQNVDGLERRLGLESGGRGKGLKKKDTKNVELHGDLGRVRCVLCFKDYEAVEEYVTLFRDGEAPDCPACLERCQSRINRAARATPIGSLRPSIVLYDEPHPLGDDIGALTTYDLGRQPDLLLIMGTSLKVHGLKRLVKEFAKSVHAGTKRGLVVFVNATAPSKEWEGVIDVHVQGETDKWVERVEDEWRKVKPADWETQTRLDGEIVPVAKPRAIKGKGKAKPLVISNKQNQYPSGLPTPRTTASPRSPAKRHGHIPSSPSISKLQISGPSKSKRDHQEITRAKIFGTDSDSELSDAPEPPTPPTPLSPTKRRANAFDSPSKKTKSFDNDIPFTGLAATPGKGNLFSGLGSASASGIRSGSGSKPEFEFGSTVDANKPARSSGSEEEWIDDDAEIFASPFKTAAKPLTTNAKKAGKSGGGISKRDPDGGGKENTPLKKATAGGGGTRRTKTIIPASSPRGRTRRTRTAPVKLDL